MLYAAAWQTPFHDFRRNLRPIALLAVGLVLVTTLVAYRVALAVAAGQHFSFSSAVSQFVIAAVGGVVIGCIVGAAVIAIHKRLDEPLIETVVTLLTPFPAYLACEAFHFSGVLAVVTAGLMVSQKVSYLFSAATRLHATAVWECVVFVLTGLSFIFIGLQMREVVTINATEEQLLWNSLVHNRGVAGSEIRARDRYGRNSHQIDL